MIDIGYIFWSTLIIFILGLITDYLLKKNAYVWIGKISYILIFLGMTWIVVTTPADETVEGMTKLTEFFISASIPLIIGEMFGATFEDIVKIFYKG